MSGSLIEYAGAKFWYMEEDGVITIGITEKGLLGLGELKGIELPEVSTVCEDGDDVGLLIGRENELTILAPKHLEVTEVNEELSGNLDLIIDDPTGDAWLFRAETL